MTNAIQIATAGHQLLHLENRSIKLKHEINSPVRCDAAAVVLRVVCIPFEGLPRRPCLKSGAYGGLSYAGMNCHDRHWQQRQQRTVDMLCKYLWAEVVWDVRLHSLVGNAGRMCGGHAGKCG